MSFVASRIRILSAPAAQHADWKMTGALSDAAAGVGSYFRQQAAAATQGHWQILQLAQTHTPGLLHAFVLAGNGMYCVPIRVPRILYINSELPPSHPEAAALGMRTSRVLPEGARPVHVYKVQSNLHKA